MPTLDTKTTTLMRVLVGPSTTRQGEKKEDSVRQDFRNFGGLQQWLPPWGCKSSSQLTHVGEREARKILALGTQALKPWGLKHQAADNDVLHQSLFSKPITEVGARKNDYIIPVCLNAALFFSAKSPEHQQAMLWGPQLTSCTKATQFRKLCISVERWSPRRRILIASINQSIHWHIKPKCCVLQSCIKYFRKLVICHLSSVKANDKCAQSFRFTVEVIGNCYKISEQKQFIFHIFCPITNKVRHPHYPP